MIVGGFGRNCLAKWLVKEARTLAAEIEHVDPKGAELLDAFGHSQATREVYGCDFFRWKKKHPQKATFEQMQLYQESEPIHAVHKEDKSKRGMTVAMTTEFEAKFKMRIEAGAFRSLLLHLSERSDVVQNINLMSVGGFCRNCLAKWLVVEARKLSSTIKGVCQGTFTDEERQLVTDVDAFGYDEAARYVYGCEYEEWKKAHAKKANSEQMAMYKASMPIHARHDKQLLEPLCTPGPATYDAPPAEEREMDQISLVAVRDIEPSQPAMTKAAPQAKKPPLLSDVCCEDIDDAPCTVPSNAYRIPPPPKVKLPLKIGILTVSDRAANGEYDHGDLSGPAVETSLTSNVRKLNTMRNELDETKIMIISVVKAIVPDDEEKIKDQLLQWSGKSGIPASCDIIFTTGGTGFSPRDITPEATQEVIDKEASGLMTFVTAQCASIQPLAALSRGTAGICDKTIIANLPGNPNGVGQVLDVLVPLLVHAVKDLKE